MSSDNYYPTKQEYIFPAHGVRTVVTYGEDRASVTKTENFKLSKADKKLYAEAIEQDLLIVKGYQGPLPVYQHSYGKNPQMTAWRKPKDVQGPVIFEYTVAEGDFLSWHAGTKQLATKTHYKAGYETGLYQQFALKKPSQKKQVATLEVELKGGRRFGKLIERFENGQIKMASHVDNQARTKVLFGDENGKLTQTAAWYGRRTDELEKKEIPQKPQSMKRAVETLFANASSLTSYYFPVNRPLVPKWVAKTMYYYNS